MAALEVRQHGVYAEALRAHLRPLATIAGLGTIFRSSGIARFVSGGVVKTFRCRDETNGLSAVSRIRHETSRLLDH